MLARELARGSALAVRVRVGRHVVCVEWWDFDAMSCAESFCARGGNPEAPGTDSRIRRSEDVEALKTSNEDAEALKTSKL